jgi:hypothetical protein
MQLVEHQYFDGRAKRRYVDGKRVSAGTYDFALVLARIENRAHVSFSTRFKTDARGRVRTVHASTITGLLETG